VALGAVTLTKWQILDPIIAIGVALNIVWSGITLIRRSVSGLMDTAIPASDEEKVMKILDEQSKHGVQYHDLRTRQAGADQFISLHILVPGKWTVQRGHNVLAGIESEILTVLPLAVVSTHLEPVEDLAAREESIMEHDHKPK
jgi:cation diffusion facilitator family transporter